MNRMLTPSVFLLLSYLLVTSSTGHPQSKFGGETYGPPALREVSVREPTHLSIVASAAGSQLVRSKLLGEIESRNARATFSLIDVEGPDGEQVSGIKIELENSTSTDQIHVPARLLSNFRDELEFIDFWREHQGECQAQRLCTHGIERCRPSQTERQEYCPGRYVTPDSEEGLILSTPRHSFRFPSVETEQMTALISEALEALE
jgi:hypothetical protein